MTAQASGCPDENLLLRVAMGSGDEGELAQVEAHVDGCESCRRALAAAASEGERAPAMRSPASLVRGERVGRYLIEELLGAGGMGVVYAARDPTLDRRVALKLLQDAEDATSGARLRREAQTMARLAHANVVPVFELGEWDGRLFLVMELVEGMTLDAWRRGTPSRPQLLQAFIEAGRGLAAAHQAGVVHRDFKPANVLIGRDGRARVTDFGLARPESARLETAPQGPARIGPIDLTRTGTLLGTLAYMAPEQLAGKPVDGRSDQFAWCVALAEALAGRRPFEGSNPQELSASMSRGPSLRGVPRSLRRVVARGLSLEPSDRFASMEALLAALESARRRRVGSVLGAGAVAAVALAVVGAMTLKASAPERVASRAAPQPLPAPVAAREDGPPAEPPPADGVLQVVVGATRRLWIPGLSQVSVVGPELADVRVADTNVLELKGIGAGETAIFAKSGNEARRWKVEVTAAPPANPPPRTLSLVAGHSTIVEVKGISRVAIGDPKVADLNALDGNQVLVVGESAGSTTLIIWKADGTREQFEIEVVTK